jgi:hypothetical protein
LIQAVTPTGKPRDAPRGSGSALAAYFLSLADAGLAQRLHVAISRELGRGPLGFGMVAEYPRGYRGRGDIDSGPLVFGVSISATGFALGSARAAGDYESFRKIFRTVYLFGAPYRHSGGREFATGGPLGNAIMFAMLTAPRAEEAAR